MREGCLESEVEVPAETWIRPGESHSAELSVGNPAVLRIPMVGHGRGELLLDVRIVSGPEDQSAGLFLCVAKTGQVPNPEVSDYHWVSEVAPADSGGWQCRIVTHEWRHGRPAVVLMGMRRDPPPVPLWYPIFRGRGVAFELLNPCCTAKTSGDFLLEARLSFTSEAAHLLEETRTAHRIYYEVYAGVNGREISEAGQQELGREDDEQLAYGEVEFLSFIKMLEALVAPAAGEIFVDLGSGTGRAVVAAALGFPALCRCTGYEIVPSLHDVAQSVAAKVLAAGCSTAPIRFHKDDLLKTKWDDADIVFVSSLCMSPETIAAIQKQSLRLKPGARVITMEADFGVGIDGFEKFSAAGATNQLVEMSFGGALLHVVRRIE